MEITLEQVERLREKSGLSYEEARDLLERCHGDLLDALIELERQGRLRPGAHPAATPTASYDRGRTREERNGAHSGDAFWEQIREGLRAVGDVLRPSSVLEIWQDGRQLTAVPLLILLLAVMFAFWITLPLLLIGLVAGCRYRLASPHVNLEVLNGALGAVSDTVEDWKESFRRRPPKD